MIFECFWDNVFILANNDNSLRQVWLSVLVGLFQPGDIQLHHL